MYEYESAKARLTIHAGLPAGNSGPELRDQTLSYHLYASDREGTAPDPAVLADVLECLAALNRHFNGPDPLNRSPGPRAHPIPDTVSYSVACILTCGLGHYRKWMAERRFAEEVLVAFLAGVHRIAYCWMQVLAGDITDLTEGFDEV